MRKPDSSRVPDRVVMEVPGVPEQVTRKAAHLATERVRAAMPRLSGRSARNLEPIWGPGWFGVMFPDPHVWYQEVGIRPFTMRKLSGTIPMWIDDPTGQERRKNPKAKTRIAADGRTQVLIFRHAAKPGERKLVTRRRGGRITQVSTPRAYPGAPGRIAIRIPPRPMTPASRSGGQIASGNVGVRWRHPGLDPKGFLATSVVAAARWVGLVPTEVIATSPTLR